MKPTTPRCRYPAKCASDCRAAGVPPSAAEKAVADKLYALADRIRDTARAIYLGYKPK